MPLDCGIDDVSLQILSCIVSVAIYVSIDPNLTFLIGMMSFFGLPILFGCSVWSGSVMCCFIGDIRTRIDLRPAIRIDSGVSLLCCRDVPDPATMNCKGCD